MSEFDELHRYIPLERIVDVFSDTPSDDEKKERISAPVPKRPPWCYIVDWQGEKRMLLHTTRSELRKQKIELEFVVVERSNFPVKEWAGQYPLLLKQEILDSLSGDENHG